VIGFADVCCQLPDDKEAEADLAAASDLCEELASAVLGDQDPDEAAFVLQSWEAACKAIVPGAPVNALAWSGALGTFWAFCKMAYGAMFAHGRKPLPGEHLVASVAGCYVLTNYRLLLLGYQLPIQQPVPLWQIHAYSVRPSALGQSTITFHLSSGHKYSLGGMPHGACPDEALMSFLIVARQWESLDELDQGAADYDRPVQEIVGMDGPAPALPRAAQPAPAPPPVMNARICSGCGLQALSGDRYCRGCGTALPDGVDAPSVGSLTVGEN